MNDHRLPEETEEGGGEAEDSPVDDTSGQGDTGDESAAGGDDLFGDDVDPDKVLEAPPAGDDEGRRDSRHEPLYDADIKAPWEGSEERWLAGEAEDTGSVRTETTEDQSRASSDRISMPDGVPATSIAPAPREMTTGHRTTILALVVMLLLMLGAGAWILDLRDEVSHQDRTIKALDDRLDSRLRQIAALRESSEARVKELEERIARHAGTDHPLALEWVSQMRRNLDQARRDVELADEEMLGEKLDEKILEAKRQKTDRENKLAMKVAGVDPTEEPPPAGEEKGPPTTDEKEECETEDLDDLLSGAVGDKELDPPKEPEEEKAEENTLPSPQPGADLPESPAREQVRASMSLIAPRVKACANGQTGRVLVRMTVQGATGRVSQAQVIDETFKGTAVGSCVSRAVRQAKFPKFATDKISIKYPFDL